jgi:hypothetical protein
VCVCVCVCRVGPLGVVNYRELLEVEVGVAY